MIKFLRLDGQAFRKIGSANNSCHCHFFSIELQRVNDCFLRTYRNQLGEVVRVKSRTKLERDYHVATSAAYKFLTRNSRLLNRLRTQ